MKAYRSSGGWATPLWCELYIVQGTVRCRGGGVWFQDPRVWIPARAGSRPAYPALRLLEDLLAPRLPVRRRGGVEGIHPPHILGACQDPPPRPLRVPAPLFRSLGLAGAGARPPALPRPPGDRGPPGRGGRRPDS